MEMVETNGDIMIKCEPVSDETELLNGLSCNGEQHQELRMLCMYRLKVADDTVSLLEAQCIDVECLRKMRIEDVDALFEGKPLGPKILFREALLEWREEIGLPCKSLRMLPSRKRPADYGAAVPALPKQRWDECPPPAATLLLPPIVQPRTEPIVSYKSFGWPLTPVTLKDMLNNCQMGRSILTVGELGCLGKSLQCQLTAIIIDYHMEFDTKITAPQLENYAGCITTLLPHENPLTYHIPRGPNRRNPGGSLYSRFINQKISKKALAIGNSIVSP